MALPSRRHQQVCTAHVFRQPADSESKGEFLSHSLAISFSRSLSLPLFVGKYDDIIWQACFATNEALFHSQRATQSLLKLSIANFLRAWTTCHRSWCSKSPRSANSSRHWRCRMWTGDFTTQSTQTPKGWRSGMYRRCSSEISTTPKRWAVGYNECKIVQIFLAN